MKLSMSTLSITMRYSNNLPHHPCQYGVLSFGTLFCLLGQKNKLGWGKKKPWEDPKIMHEDLYLYLVCK